ncbi:hypothetical protein Scep_023626 [Stephania cephalantha]|uniref:Uncharacterized protein n=1 Tax=Stephania cephalantha TaxID=152367 RepID=A0AAP0EW18_9MAGN
MRALRSRGHRPVDLDIVVRFAIAHYVVVRVVVVRVVRLAMRRRPAARDGAAEYNAASSNVRVDVAEPAAAAVAERSASPFGEVAVTWRQAIKDFEQSKGNSRARVGLVGGGLTGSVLVEALITKLDLTRANSLSFYLLINTIMLNDPYCGTHNVICSFTEAKAEFCQKKLAKIERRELREQKSALKGLTSSRGFSTGLNPSSEHPPSVVAPLSYSSFIVVEHPREKKRKSKERKRGLKLWKEWRSSMMVAMTMVAWPWKWERGMKLLGLVLLVLSSAGYGVVGLNIWPMPKSVNHGRRVLCSSKDFALDARGASIQILLVFSKMASPDFLILFNFDVVLSLELHDVPNPLIQAKLDKGLNDIANRLMYHNQGKKQLLKEGDFERIINGLKTGGLIQEALRMYELMQACGFVASESLKFSLRASQTFQRQRPTEL